jgi:polyisoprenyl-phosphate glycosyltransferase
MSGPVAEAGQILGGPVGAVLAAPEGRSPLVYSVVIPVFNEQENVESVVARVSKVFDEIGEPYEILFVDDGSRDRTAELLRELCEKNSRVRAVRFSRNFGQEAAVQAGYLFARGEWIMQMDGDLQNPPEDAHKLIARRDEGFDIIFGVRRGRKDPIFRKAASSLMQWTMRRLLDIELPRDISTFRLMRASTAKLLASMPERQKFLSALACWVGVRHTTVDVTHAARAAGKTKYNLGKLINNTFDLVVGFSSRPLRLLGIVGLLVAFVGFGGAIWAVVEKLVWGTMMGWSSIFAAVLTMGGMQLAALSLIGEYVSRIFVQAQQRPIFMVAEQMGAEPRAVEQRRPAESLPQESAVS